MSSSYDDCLADEQIEFVHPDLVSPVDHGDKEFAHELDPVLLQLDAERVGVDRLDETRAERAMNFDRRTDDRVGEIFMRE